MSLVIEYEDGIVLEHLSSWGSTQELLVRMIDGALYKAIHYLDHESLLLPGDHVRLNTTAETLELGSGGYHYVHTVLKRAINPSEDAPPALLANEHSNRSSGHIMKIRYTSIQRSVLAVEEPSSPHHHLFLDHQSLDGMPVLIGELHSMLPIVASWIIRRQQLNDVLTPIKICYVMSDGAALPISFSKHVQLLREMNWITGSITYGHAYGGDVETVNKFTALLAAKYILQSDIAIVIMGPGIVGTGTLLGHSGMEVSELVHAVSMLGGTPILIPRISFADERERHRGFSHHLLTLLSQFTLTPVLLPLPSDLPDEHTHCLQQQLHKFELDKHQITWIHGVNLEQVEQSLDHYPAQVKSMGRCCKEDPTFYISISCAAELALSYVHTASP